MPIKIEMRMDLKSWSKLATVSIHKQTYKVNLDAAVFEDFKSIVFYFPRSITEIELFDKDNTNNQFTEFLDIKIDKWFADKEGYVENYEHIIIAAE